MEKLEQLMKDAVKHVKEVYNKVPHLVNCHPNFIKELDGLDLSHDYAPMHLKQVIYYYARQLHLVLDWTSVELMKIWDYDGDGLMVVRGDKCFVVIHDLNPEPKILREHDCIFKVSKIHNHMFLCLMGPQYQAAFLFEYALVVSHQYWTNHKKHMSAEEMSLKLSKDAFLNVISNHEAGMPLLCDIVIAGFSDDNEARIYHVDCGSYRLYKSDMAVTGWRASSIARQCMDLRANNLEYAKLYDKAARAFFAALANPLSRHKLRARAYIVTPNMTQEMRLEGKGEVRGFYLLS